MDQQAYRLPHAPEAAALARRLVEEHLSPLLDDDRGRDLVAMTSELVSNAVKHAPELPDGGHELLFEVTGGAIRVAVTDGGKHLDPNELGFEGPADERLGMMMVDLWSDGWGFSLDGVKGVWFTVRR